MQWIRFVFILSLVPALTGCGGRNIFFASPLLYPNSQTSYTLIKNLEKQGVQTVLIGEQLRLILPSDNFFQTGTATLNPNKISVLTQIANLLRREHYPPITVSGHTDNIGSRQAKLALSEQQAHAIASYLWSQGIPLSKMRVVGYGDTKPIASNDTPLGSAENRRIEIN